MEWEKVFRDLANLIDRGAGKRVIPRTNSMIGTGSKTWFSESASPKDMAEAHAFRGSAYIICGEPEKAKADFTSALKLDPKNERALYGETHLSAQDPPEGEQKAQSSK